MKQFKVIHEGKEYKVLAAGWQIGIGGYYIFLDDKNETVAVVPPTALIGNSENIK